MKTLKERESPEEHDDDQTLVGSPSKKIQRRQWLPQNFRLYYRFKKSRFRPPNQPSTNHPDLNKGWVETTGYSYKPVNHGKEHLFMNWHWCNILVKKSQVSITYKKLGGQWFDIFYRNPKQYESFIRKKEAEFEEDCLKALKLFIAYFGGASDFKVVRMQRYDCGFAGDKDIDSLPAHLRVNTPLFKKDYMEKFEYKGSEPMINKVYNESLKNELPDLHEKMDALLTISEASIKQNASTSDVLRKVAEVQDDWKINFRKHQGVLEKTEQQLGRLGDAVFQVAEGLESREKKHRLELIKTAYRQAFGGDYW